MTSIYSVLRKIDDASYLREIYELKQCGKERKKVRLHDGPVLLQTMKAWCAAVSEDDKPGPSYFKELGTHTCKVFKTKVDMVEFKYGTTRIYGFTLDNAGVDTIMLTLCGVNQKGGQTLKRQNHSILVAVGRACRYLNGT